MKQSIAILGTALLLAGCQSVQPVALSSQSSILEAGFSVQPLSAQTSTGTPANMRVSEFVCLPARCGAVVGLGLVAMDIASPNPNMTAEMALKSDLLDRRKTTAALRASIQRRFSARTDGARESVTSLTFYPKSASLHFTAIKTNGRETLHMSAFGRFTGNTVTMIVAASPNAAIAARYARPNWIK